jgi:choice-of-anchor C domain-containing protein
LYKSFLFAALLVLGLVLGPAGGHASLITNGGFETGTAPPLNDFRTLFAGDASYDDISGWTVTGGSVDWKNTYWTPQEGTKSLDLSGSIIGEISTTFATIPDTVYTVTFYLSGNFAGGNTTKRVKVSADGQSQIFYFAQPPDWSRTNMGWTPKTWTFTADDASALLTFASLDNNAFGPALDQVEVLAPSPVVIPLPGTMWLLGSGLLGLWGWRRKKTK